MANYCHIPDLYRKWWITARFKQAKPLTYMMVAQNSIILTNDVSAKRTHITGKNITIKGVAVKIVL